MKSVLVITKETENFRTIRRCFSDGCRVDMTAHIESSLKILQTIRYDIIFIDIDILKESTVTRKRGYQDVLQPFWHLFPTIEIIVISSQERIRDAVMAMKAGASNYITYPINTDEVIFVTENIRESLIVQSELDYLRDQFWDRDTIEVIQTKNHLMKIVYEKIRSVAPTKSTVLLTGETGTGKSVLANLIHRHSNRKDAQFIAVHCGAIPDTLVESELFGHEKGAFTGAVKRKLGKFEIAQGGTIFLDEVGTITSSAQIKLLQVLQDGSFQRVGGEETFDANVRVIAATNVDLKKMCEEGRFRKDLYYRLNVFPIEIPPLSQRVEDIPHFIHIFLKKMNMLNTKVINDVDHLVVEALMNYPWPGNIRELENLIERAFILENSFTLTPESFPGELFDTLSSAANASINSSLTLAMVRRRGLEEIEKAYIKDMLTEKKGKIKDSAEVAGITTRQFHKLMKKYGYRKEEFKVPTTSDPNHA